MFKVNRDEWPKAPWIWGAIFILLILWISTGPMGLGSQLLFGITLAMAFAGLFLMHLHFNRALKAKEEALEQQFAAECQQQLRTLRHQHRNQLQILTGYLEMGLHDEGLDYLNRMASATHDHRLSMEQPELELVIYSAIKTAKSHGIQTVLELHRIQPNQTQVAVLGRALKTIFDLAIGQLAYVRGNELIKPNQPQMIHITSGMLLERDSWFFEVYLEGMPLGASRALANKLVNVIADLAEVNVMLSYEIKASQLIIKLEKKI